MFEAAAVVAQAYEAGLWNINALHSFQKQTTIWNESTKYVNPKHSFYLSRQLSAFSSSFYSPFHSTL